MVLCDSCMQNVSRPKSNQPCEPSELHNSKKHDNISENSWNWLTRIFLGNLCIPKLECAFDSTMKQLHKPGAVITLSSLFFKSGFCFGAARLNLWQRSRVIESLLFIKFYFCCWGYSFAVPFDQISGMFSYLCITARGILNVKIQNRMNSMVNPFTFAFLARISYFHRLQRSWTNCFKAGLSNKL